MTAETRCKNCGAVAGVPGEKWDDPTFNTVCPLQGVSVTGMCFCVFWHSTTEVRRAGK